MLHTVTEDLAGQSKDFVYLASQEQGMALTKREIEILRLLSEHKRTKEIAALLFISQRTVDFHLRNIYTKLNVHNRLHALQVARHQGVLSAQATYDHAARDTRR